MSELNKQCVSHTFILVYFRIYISRGIPYDLSYVHHPKSFDGEAFVQVPQVSTRSGQEEAGSQLFQSAYKGRG